MSSNNGGTKSSGEKFRTGNPLDGRKNQMPGAPEKKSLDGITNLKPKPTELPEQQQQPQSTPSTPPTESGSKPTGNDD